MRTTPKAARWRPRWLQKVVLCGRLDAILESQLSCRRARAGSSTESGRTPAFFM
jgi:hypothetical protein